jgi:hypothetical protein
LLHRKQPILSSAAMTFRSIFMTLKLEKTPHREPRMSDIATQLSDILHDIRFGSIEIIIHEGKVVQIERKEKLRFDHKK